MPYRPLLDFVLRAPLLPVVAVAAATRHLRRDPLGPTAISLASPSLAAHLGTPAAARALERYARRAAFRTTPQGLLSGVAMGRLAATTRIATGQDPRACFDLGWQRAAALARALLDEPDNRRAVRLRQTPSLLRAVGSVRWLAMGHDRAEERQAACDARLDRLLAATCDWTPWVTAARAVVDEPGDNGDHADNNHADNNSGERVDADEFLLLLLDDGLLLDDLTPPLLGPAPMTWLRARLAQLPAAGEAARTLAQVEQHLRANDTAAAETTLRACPGARNIPGDRSGLQAVLVHQPSRAPTLARAAVERAAALAPLLFRLQEALAAPASERLAQASVGEALTSVVESFGAGALDVSALASGDYGVPFGSSSSDEDDSDNGDDQSSDEDSGANPSEPPRALLTFLLDAIAAASAAQKAQVDLSSKDLAAVLGDTGPTPPPTAELFLAPCRTPAGARPGAGWLLGLHAPAGASWGRFAHALAPALPEALARLHDVERTCMPDVELVDVAYAPSSALGDLGAHPSTRATALALTSWPAPPTAALTPAALELCADPTAPDPLTLRRRETRSPVVPATLSRVRSATAPAGIFRLLTGFGLYRQHAPWALTPGPLAALARLPRIAVDGFVISPASWRVPPKIADGTQPGIHRALGRWRRAANLPRLVQVGHEDELLPVDLQRPDATDDLRGAARVWEIWPPLPATVDRDGRRVEAVVALCDHPSSDDRHARAAAAQTTRTMGEVPPPRVQPAADGWTTFKLFGADQPQDRVLTAAVVPAVGDALSAGEIDAWFFLRYRERPGPRPHLRLRIHGTPPATARFAARLETALLPWRRQGAVVGVETAAYHPERARLGDPAAVAAAHQIYQSDSTLVAALLARSVDEDAQHTGGSGGDPITDLVRSFDALAAGCGLPASARWVLAAERRRAITAAARASDGADADFRARSRALRAALAGDDAAAADTDATNEGNAGALFVAHRRRVADAVAMLSPQARAQLLPTLLHLAAVRLAGPHPSTEARATILWERTREGLARSRPPHATR